MISISIQWEPPLTFSFPLCFFFSCIIRIISSLLILHVSAWLQVTTLHTYYFLDKIFNKMLRICTVRHALHSNMTKKLLYWHILVWCWLFWMTSKGLLFLDPISMLTTWYPGRYQYNLPSTGLAIEIQYWHCFVKCCLNPSWTWTANGGIQLLVQLHGPHFHLAFVTCQKLIHLSIISKLFFLTSILIFSQYFHI